MHRSRRTASRLFVAMVGTTALSTACTSPETAPAAKEAPGVYTLLHEHIATKVGPNRDEPCDIDSDLYLPADADAEHQAPALIYSHGFGATKTQETAMTAELARRGYVVLAYTQLGHEGSGCQIHLDDPDYEGAVVSQLIDYLAGVPGLAFADAEHTKPLPPVDVVERSEQDDPKVGMIGGSYGGQIQFVAAAHDPRIDVLVPGVTWNDLAQEIAPNYAVEPDATRRLPGVPKAQIAESLLRSGEHDPNLNFAQVKLSGRGCVRIAPEACQTLIDLGATKGLSEADRAVLLAHSAMSFIDQIHVPVLLCQGQEDSLAPFNEAARNYQALRKQGVPVQLLWHRFGHDTAWGEDGPIGDSGWDFAPGKVEHAYASMQIIHWLDHYLKDDPVSTGPSFSYYRDWTDGPGVESAVTYGPASQYPAGVERTWNVASDGRLVDQQAQTSGTTHQTAGGTEPAQTFTSEALAEPVDVVGSGSLTLPITGPEVATLFVTLQDVAPDGSVSAVTKLPSAARFNTQGPVTIELVGVVHRFAPGHRVRIAIAGSDPQYLDPHSTPVTMTLGGYNAHLTLPVVPAR